MNNEEAKQILHRKLDDYRVLSRDLLEAKIGQGPDVLEVKGESGATYQIEIEVIWDAKKGGDIRVMGGIDDGGWRAFVPLTEDFLVTPSGQVL